MEHQEQNAVNARRHTKLTVRKSGSKHELQKPQLPARPAANDAAAWPTYWQAQDQSWRTEPEISGERQEELKEHRDRIPDITAGNLPFWGMQLNRADVEWLIATREGEQGLDLRGAKVSDANLSNLPLTGLQVGFS